MQTFKMFRQMKVWIMVFAAVGLLAVWLCASAFMQADSITKSADHLSQPNHDSEKQSPALLASNPQTEKKSLDPQTWERIKQRNQERTKNGVIRDAAFAAEMREWYKKFPVGSAVATKLDDMDAVDIAPLLNGWNLSPEEIAQINSVVSSRNRSLEKLRRERLATTDPGQHAQSNAEAARVESEAKTKLTSLLGEDKQAQLDIWQKAKDERALLAGFDVQLQAAGAVLSHSQMQSVMDAMYQARQSILGGKRISATPLLGDKSVQYRQEVLRLVAPSISTQQKEALNSFLQLHLGSSEGAK